MKLTLHFLLLPSFFPLCSSIMGTLITSNPSNSEAKPQDFREEKYFDYSPRAQWLRAVVLGSNEGLVLTTLLVMETGRPEAKPLDVIIKGFVSLLAGALAMATSEFVSVYTQVDTVRSQNERDLRVGKVGALARARPPSPTQIAAAASISYILAGSVPLLLPWIVRDDQKLRSSLAAALASLSMALVASIVAFLGKASLARSCIRVIMGGWIEVGIMMRKGKVLENYGL